MCSHCKTINARITRCQIPVCVLTWVGLLRSIHPHEWSVPFQPLGPPEASLRGAVSFPQITAGDKTMRLDCIGYGCLLQIRIVTSTLRVWQTVIFFSFLSLCACPKDADFCPFSLHEPKIVSKALNQSTFRRRSGLVLEPEGLGSTPASPPQHLLAISSLVTLSAW